MLVTSSTNLWVSKGAGMAQGRGWVAHSISEHPEFHHKPGAAASTISTLILVKQCAGSSIFVQQHPLAVDQFLLPIFLSNFRKKSNPNSSWKVADPYVNRQEQHIKVANLFLQSRMNEMPKHQQTNICKVECRTQITCKYIYSDAISDLCLFLLRPGVKW